MLTATKVFQFDCAHMLSGHQGLCKNLHGHTYKLEVEVVRAGQSDLIEDGPSEGMVIDFRALKEAVQDVAGPFDHAFIFYANTTNPVEQSICGVLKSHGLRVVDFPTRPTAENMAQFFYDQLNSALEVRGIFVNRVRVWETPTSYAEVI